MAARDSIVDEFFAEVAQYKQALTRSYVAILGKERAARVARLDGHILLWHGYQADPSCSGLWARVAKFFVGKFWTALQRWGVKHPTRAANNPGRCDEIDETLHEWASGAVPVGWGFIDVAGKGILDSRLRGNDREKGGNDREKGGNDRGGSGKIDTIIAGHTHRPVFENLSLTERMYLEGRMGNMGGAGNKGGTIPKSGEFARKYGDTIPNSIDIGSCPRISSDRAYYNTGSCVHPRCITGLEITPGK